METSHTKPTQANEAIVSIYEAANALAQRAADGDLPDDVSLAIGALHEAIGDHVYGPAPARTSAEPCGHAVDDCEYDPFAELERVEGEAEARAERSVFMGYCDADRRRNPEHCCSQCEPEQRVRADTARDAIRDCARKLERLQAETKKQWSSAEAYVAEFSARIFSAARAEMARRNDPDQTYAWLRGHIHLAGDSVSVTIDDRPCLRPWKHAAGFVVVVHVDGEGYDWVELPYPEWAIEHDRKVSAAVEEWRNSAGADGEEIPF